MAWAAFVSVVALAGLATAPSIVDIIETGRSDARVVAIFLLLFGSMAAVATFLAPGNWDSMIRSAGRFSPARGAGGGIVTVILSYLALTVVSFFVSPPGGLAIGVGFAFVGPALLMIGAACGAVVTLQCRARLLRLRRVREQADGPADTAAITRGRACWSARLLGRPGSHSRWADGEVGARIDRAGRWAALVFGLLVAAVVWWLVPHVIGYARSGWPHTVHEFGALALTVPVMAVVAPRLWAWMAGGTSGVSVRHGVVGGNMDTARALDAGTLEVRYDIANVFNPAYSVACRIDTAALAALRK